LRKCELTESLVTAQDALKELDRSVKQWTDEAEEQKKAASSKNENCKLEYSAGEKMFMKISLNESK
jgi:hypothetical protein